jgi:hypothetical protein
VVNWECTRCRADRTEKWASSDGQLYGCCRLCLLFEDRKQEVVKHSNHCLPTSPSCAAATDCRLSCSADKEAAAEAPALAAPLQPLLALQPPLSPAAQRYDAVCFNAVLHHLPDARAALARGAALLRPSCDGR